MQLATTTDLAFVEPETRPTPAPLTKFLNSGWLALIFYGLATIIFSWPLAFNLSDTLPDWGDPADSTWRIGTLAQNLATNPFDLYQTSAFYPVKNGLALDELLTGQAGLAAPIIWLSGNPVLAFNLLIFFAYLLSGFSMWLLVRHLTGSSPAGLVAGLIYAFSPWHYSHHSHLGLSSQHWMVFALYFLIRFLEESQQKLTARSLRFLGLFAVCFWLQALVAGYYAYFGAILFGFYLVYYFAVEARLFSWFWQQLRRESPLLERSLIIRQVGGLAVGSFLMLCLLIPFVQPFMEAQSKFSFKRDLNEAAYWSAAPTSLLRTTERSWLYKPIQYGVFKLQTSAERAMYPGLAAVGLALFGLLTSSRVAKTRPRWVFGSLALTGLLLSFGPVLNMEAYGLQPTGIGLPYRFLYDNVPGFDALRVPQRFGQLFMLGLAVCAGYGTARLLNFGKSKTSQISKPAQSVRPALGRFSWSTGLSLLIILAIITADYIAPNVPLHATPTGEKAPPLYSWLANPQTVAIVPKDALLLELPMSASSSAVNTNPVYLLYGLFHKRPMLNGSANIMPAGYERLVREMQSFPSTATLDIIEGLGVKFVVVHTQHLPAEANRNALDSLATPNGRLELVQQFGPAKVFRVRPNPQRFAELAKAIPEGSRVLLGDHDNRSKLYTAVLPRLIGKKRHYFLQYQTVYEALDDNAAPLPAPNQIFDYAIFYKGTNKTKITSLQGLNLQLVSSNEIVEVYKVSRVGLTQTSPQLV